MLSNKVYDVLKAVAQYILPGLATLYSALSVIWGLPYTEKIVGSIMVLDTLLGVLLGIANTQYKAKMFIQPTLLDSNGMKMAYFTSITPQVYDALAWGVNVFLPAMASAYFGLSTIWGFPFGKQVVESVAAVDIFLGIILGFLSAQYKKDTNSASTESA